MRSPSIAAALSASSRSAYRSDATITIPARSFSDLRTQVLIGELDQLKFPQCLLNARVLFKFSERKHRRDPVRSAEVDPQHPTCRFHWTHRRRFIAPRKEPVGA